MPLLPTAVAEVEPSTRSTLFIFFTILLLREESTASNSPASVSLSTNDHAEVFFLFGHAERANYARFSTCLINKTILNPTYDTLETSTVYWSDNSTRRHTSIVESIPVKNSTISNRVIGLTIDWISRLLYWSDEVFKRICVTDTNFHRFWLPLVETNLTSPQDVAIYPPKSYLFWSDIGNQSKIERLDVANNIRKIIVSDGLIRPTTLVIDFETQRLLWLDSGASTMGSIFLNGSDPIYWSLDLLSHVSTFVLFKSYIFLGDRNQPTSYVYNFSEKSFIGSVTWYNQTGITDMKIHDQHRQPSVKSPCSVQNGGCSHFCLTINATSRVCNCSEGHFLDTDGTSCLSMFPTALVWSSTSTDPSNYGHAELFVIYGDPENYRNDMQSNTTFSGNFTKCIHKRILNSTYDTLETDFSTSTIYWSNKLQKNIEMGSIDTSLGNYKSFSLKTITNSNGVTGLTIDWVSRLLYWSDEVKKQIFVADTVLFQFRLPLVETSLNSPQDVAIYPHRSYLFWSDVSKIERLDVANGIREVIVSNLSRPTTLVIDFTTERILWLESDASRIGSTFLNGSGFDFWNLNLLNRISSFVLLKSYIFLGDRNLSTSYVYNFSEKSFVGSVTSCNQTGIIDMAVYDKSRQPHVTSPCSNQNGKCSHFCFTRNATSRVCKCSDGYFLKKDGTSCEKNNATDEESNQGSTVGLTPEIHGEPIRPIADLGTTDEVTTSDQGSTVPPEIHVNFSFSICQSSYRRHQSDGSKLDCQVTCSRNRESMYLASRKVA